MDQLSVDLTLYLNEGGTCAGVFRIVDRLPGQALPGNEQGVLRCRVEKLIHSQAAKPGDVISIRYSRKTDPLAQAKSGINHWNVLPLEKEVFLLLVCKPAPGNTPWQALSGIQIEGPDDPAVAALRECYRIRDLPRGKEDQRLALEAAIEGEEPILRHYALEAIARDEIVSRAAACEIIVKALGTGAVTDEDRVRFAIRLASAPIFDEDQGDDPVNRKAVAGLAGTVGQLKDPADQEDVVRYLASCVLQELSEDAEESRKIATKLLHGIAKSPPKPIADALARMLDSQEEDDQKTARELLDIWKRP